MNISIVVIGEANEQYINRIVTGEYNNRSMIKNTMDVYTNNGIFRVDFKYLI